MSGTVADTLAQAGCLADVSDTPLLDGQLLLAWLLGKPRAWLFAHDDAEVSCSKAARFQALVARRSQGEPLAYLLGEREFRGHRFKVNHDTLIPRPETELLVDAALEHCAASPKLVADLGTGSGAIAVTLAAARPDWQVIATDISHGALLVARENADNANSTNNITMVQSDWLAAFKPNSFDLLLANPPYIPAGDPHLPALGYEPRLALVSGEDGLDDIKRIAAGAMPLLKAGASLLLEHGHDQGKAVRKLLISHGYQQLVQLRDIQGHERVALARKPA